MKRMIFHMTVPYDPNSKTGSHIRPIEMVKAFKENGYVVDEVTGYGRERKEALKKLILNIKNGYRYEFLYSELSTMPMFLTEKHHFPLFFYLELKLFLLCRRNSIPITAFYRDIYWRFDLFQTGTSFFKKVIAHVFYYIELIFLSKFAAILFLPSLEMKDAFPYKFSRTTFLELPPGISPKVVGFQKENILSQKILNLIYVGGVLPPLYDLRGAIQTISNIENVNLTIVCRKDEWNIFGKDLTLTKNINIKHLSGKELELEYSKADLSLIVLGNHPYRRFCMPLKLFEAISFETPVILLSSMKAASNLVKDHDLGYIIDSESDLIGVFEKILKSRDDLKQKVLNNSRYKEFITWNARAQFVSNKASRT
jgi:hypothetical protein